MTDDEIDDLVSLVADHFGLYGRLLNSDTDLRRDLEADDIDRREVLITIEELFQTKFSVAEMANLTRLGDIINAVEQARSARKSIKRSVS